MWNKSFSICQVWNQLFYNASDFEVKILRHVSFSRKIFFQKAWFWRKKISKKYDFEEKINFKKQILKKMLHTKKHVLIQFTPSNAHFLSITCNFKKARFCRKKFSKKHDFECKFFSKKHNFEWKSFCKKHDCEIKVFHFVRFGINFSTTRQILK